MIQRIDIEAITVIDESLRSAGKAIAGPEDARQRFYRAANKLLNDEMLPDEVVQTIELAAKNIRGLILDDASHLEGIFWTASQPPTDEEILKFLPAILQSGKLKAPNSEKAFCGRVRSALKENYGKGAFSEWRVQYMMDSILRTKMKMTRSIRDGQVPRQMEKRH